MHILGGAGGTGAPGANCSGAPGTSVQGRVAAVVVKKGGGESKSEVWPYCPPFWVSVLLRNGVMLDAGSVARRSRGKCQGGSGARGAVMQGAMSPCGTIRAHCGTG